MLEFLWLNCLSHHLFSWVFTFSKVCVWWLQHLDHLSVKYCGNNLRLFLRFSWGEFPFFFFFCGVESDYKQITLFHSWNEMFQRWVFIFTKACQQIHASVTESLYCTCETNPALLINFIQCKAKNFFLKRLTYFWVHLYFWGSPSRELTRILSC